MAIEDRQQIKDDNGDGVTVEPFLDEVWIDAAWGDLRTSPVLINFTPDQATAFATALLDAAGRARGAQL